MSIGVDSAVFDRVQLRELAENDLAQRLERVEGVAAVTVSGGLRRQIHIDLSKEKITAMDLAVDRVISTIRSENQNVPLGDWWRATRAICSAARASSRASSRFATWSFRRRTACRCYPARYRRHSGHDRGLASFTRINGKPGVRLQVRSSRARTRWRLRRRAREIDRIESRRAERPADAARRPVQVHRAIDRGGQGRRLPRRVPGHRDHLHLPAKHPVDVHHLPVDSDFHHRHVRAALFRGLHAESR
jgi:hypothetical protein